MWRSLANEASMTPSPNGGWPMGAMALRLGVRLRKPGVYALNRHAASPDADDVPRAVNAAKSAASAGMALAVAACLTRGLLA